MSDKNDVVDDQDVNNGPKDDDEGREDVKDDDKGAEGTDDEDDEDEPESKQTYTKADIEKAAKRRQAALDRARKAEKELSDLRKATATKEQKLQIEAEEKAAEQAAKFKPALVKQHVAYEMAFLGLTKDQIEEVVAFVKMENIEVDEENSVDGVEDEVLRIKNKFPSLFPEPKDDSDEEDKKPAPKKKAPKGDGAPKPTPKKPMTAAEKIRAQLRGEKV